MGKTSIIQTSGAAGEVSPNFLGRVDLETYFKSLKQARNVKISPLGTIKRREGTAYIDNTSADSAGRLVPFAFNIVRDYLLVFTPGEMRVYKDDVLQTTVSTAPISTLTATIISEMNWTQSADTLFLVHPYIPPIPITR